MTGRSAAAAARENCQSTHENEQAGKARTKCRERGDRADDPIAFGVAQANTDAAIAVGNGRHRASRDHHGEYCGNFNHSSDSHGDPPGSTYRSAIITSDTVRDFEWNRSNAAQSIRIADLETFTAYWFIRG
jgi:hypothetical protein